MEILLGKVKSWDCRKVIRLYKSKKFISQFVDAFSNDDEAQRFIYANAFYERVRFDKKIICDKISDQELRNIVMQEYEDFIYRAEQISRKSYEVDDLFRYIECDGIYDEMDAVMFLRDELMFGVDDISEIYFHDGKLDSISDDMISFFVYDSRKHSGKKFRTYIDWIMQHNDALGFLGGSMYLQEIIDPADEMNFDLFYEHLQNFISNIMFDCDIEKDSKVIKTTFSRDLKKIFKNVYKTNRDLSL